MFGGELRFSISRQSELSFWVSRGRPDLHQRSTILVDLVNPRARPTHVNFESMGYRKEPLRNCKCLDITRLLFYRV